jgi:hypothetical protein
MELKPNSEPQEFFLRLPDNILEAMCGGEAGGGKSHALIIYPILRGWYKHPQFKGIIFRQTFPQLEKSLIPRAQEIYGPLGGKWNGNEHVFDFKRSGGGKIWLSYLESKADAREHDTNEFNYIGFDELTHFDIDVYKYLLHRCRTSTAGLPNVVRCGATPGGKGNFWVYKRFVRPFPAGRRRLQETFEGKSIERTYVPIKLENNIDLIRENPNYVAQINMLPEAERRAKRGDWLAFTGQVFKEFRVVKLESEPPEALHVIPPFKIPAWWPRIIAIDWGYSAFTCVLWGAISPDSELIVYRIYLAKQTNISVWAKEIKDRSVGENIIAVVIDPSASKRFGHEKTITEQVSEALERPIENADNDRLGGKMLLHELFAWEQPEEPPPPPPYNEDEYHQCLQESPAAASAYLSRYQPYVKEILPKCKIFSSLDPLIEAIQVCDYDENKPEDVKEFDGDDPYDCVRYLAKIFHRYTKLSRTEFERLMKVNDVMRQYETSGDYSTFDRRMRRLERDEHARKSPVKRTRDFGNRSRFKRSSGFGHTN